MRFYAAALLSGLASAVARPTTSGTATLKLSIPKTGVRDEFYTVNVDFSGQELPLLLDTGSDDILVGSNECPSMNKSSGCYNSKLFQIPQHLKIVNNETFTSVVGSGPVIGNQSFMDVTFGSIKVQNLGVPLIYSAAEDEFQNGSFSGIWGVGMLNSSREYHYFHDLPPFNKMVTEKLLNKPVFSVTVPRYGDPASPEYGNLTLGEIGPVPSNAKITYSDIIAVRDYNKGYSKYAYQTWTQVVQGFRVNGASIPIPKKGQGEKGQFIATMDTGGEQLFIGSLFTQAVKHFKGKTEVIPDVWAYFDCSEPQLVEFKMNDQWIPINPLDMIQPGQTKMVNGTEMCKATLQAGNSAFSDVLLGPQFFRNALTVFDYVSTDLFSVPPRVGIAPLTDGTAAVKRYPSIYKNRLE